MTTMSQSTEDPSSRLSTARGSARQQQLPTTYGTVQEETTLSSKPREEEKAYDINDFVTFRVFSQYHGTVLMSQTLWDETIAMALMYWGVFGVMLSMRWKGFSDFLGDEASVRAFIAMFSTLIGLLLSFYTSLNLGRWWQMRQQVHLVSEASKQLTVSLAAAVTKDEDLLLSIERYTRASLFLVFCSGSDGRAHGQALHAKDQMPLDAAVSHKMLTQEEADRLMQSCPKPNIFVQSQMLWTWLASAISRLNDQGLTKGPPHYTMLMGVCEKGRQAICDIQSYLETPIPKEYVHLLCLMVKLHNFILTILMAFTAVMHWGHSHTIGIFRATFRAFFMPVLYNAILIFNAEASNPFGSDEVDFPFWKYSKEIEVSSKAFLSAIDNMPEHLAGKKKYEKVFVKPEEP